MARLTLAVVVAVTLGAGPDLPLADPAGGPSLPVSTPLVVAGRLPGPELPAARFRPPDELPELELVRLLALADPVPLPEPPPPPVVEAPPDPPRSPLPGPPLVRAPEPPPDRYVNLAPCGGDLPPCYVKARESGGDYTARNPTSSASGAWQFLDSTWAGFGGYPRAYLAPPDVQDARARELWAGGAGCSHWSAC